MGGGLLAALIAFTPSFAFVLPGANRFDRLRRDSRARAFLDGAGPAAIVCAAVIAFALNGYPWWWYVILGQASVTAALLRVVWQSGTSGPFSVSQNRQQNERL